jgi:hypothetical protein
VLDFDQMSNAGVKSELENGHSVPRNVKVKKPCRDSSMQTGDYMRPEIEYYYVPAVEELSQAIVYGRIYYKYAEGQYGDLNVNMPLRILRQCVDDHASQLFDRLVPQDRRNTSANLLREGSTAARLPQTTTRIR